MIVTMVAAMCLVAAVSNPLMDFDFWQHLAVGKAIWQLHTVPTTNLWTWPEYGKPTLLPSWLFRAMLWPFWSVGGVTGLFAWRWLTTLLVFGLLWLCARRMGARGLAPLAVFVACGLIYRVRSQVRPETLVAVLFSLYLLLLETRRHGGRDRSAWLIPIACVWINAHISYHLGFLLIGIHWLDALLRGRSGDRSQATRLLWIGVGALAISFVNPFGWRSLWQPFDFYLNLRKEPIFLAIGELEPAWGAWGLYVRNGYPFLVVAWPLLLAWRARRKGLDRVELAVCVIFTWLGLVSHRFTAIYAIIAAPYLARDLTEWLASHRFAARPSPTLRAGAVVGFCLGLTALEFTGPLGGPSLAIRTQSFPIGACDFMVEQGVRGRGFNYFHYGGYQLFRFWPARDRLPFMGIHPESENAWNRYHYFFALSESTAWRTLDEKYHFDYALLSHQRLSGERLPDQLDADTSWALVFIDDPSSIYVRRRGPLAEVAQRFEYRKLGGGTSILEALRAECRADADSCAVVVAELERAIRSSPVNGEAHSLLANAELLRGNLASARSHLSAAQAVDARIPRVHERLGIIALEENHPAEALREFRAERRIRGSLARIELLIGQAHRRLGNVRAARAAFRRAVARDPASTEARDSLAVIERERRAE